jgi:Ala-tRNA(Pro) deacylase
MIPNEIVQYLQEHHVPFTRHWHPRAVSAQRLAAAVHVSGYKVAKSVIVDVDGKLAIAVLPATEMLDEELSTKALNAREVKLAEEESFRDLFGDCELGAEPPFGRLYGLPVIVDSRLPHEGTIIFRAGSHEETLEMHWVDFASLENPIVAPIGEIARPIPRQTEELGYGG